MLSQGTAGAQFKNRVLRSIDMRHRTIFENVVFVKERVGKRLFCCDASDRADVEHLHQKIQSGRRKASESLQLNKLELARHIHS